MNRPLTNLAFSLVLLAGACSTSSQQSTQSQSVTLVTHDSFFVTDGIFDSFTKATGITVTVAQGADAGVVLNQAILTKGRPDGDVLWGVDNTLASRAVSSGAFASYKSSALKNLDPGVVAFVPKGNELTPVDVGDVCINADVKWFAKKSLAVPTSLAMLTDPAYKELLVVQNPATSSPGLAFLLATIAHSGETGWQQYWKDLRRNGVQVVDGWVGAYTVEFSGSAGKGSRPLVVSYGSSPAAEVSDDGTSPTVALKDTCFHQVEYVGILKGTKHEAAARKLVDFLLSAEFQADVAPNMYVFPAVQGVTVPPAFATHGIRPTKPFDIPASDIEKNRERWINEWTTIVLR